VTEDNDHKKMRHVCVQALSGIRAEFIAAVKDDDDVRYRQTLNWLKRVTRELERVMPPYPVEIVDCARCERDHEVGDPTCLENEGP
jgi:hypothetical protein